MANSEEEKSFINAMTSLMYGFIKKTHTTETYVRPNEEQDKNVGSPAASGRYQNYNNRTVGSPAAGSRYVKQSKSTVNNTNNDGHHPVVKAKTKWLRNGKYTEIIKIILYLKNHGFKPGSKGDYVLCSASGTYTNNKGERRRTFVVAKAVENSNGTGFTYYPNINEEIGWKKNNDYPVPNFSDDIQAVIDTGVFTQESSEYLVFSVKYPELDFTLFSVPAPTSVPTSVSALHASDPVTVSALHASDPVTVPTSHASDPATTVVKVEEAGMNM